MFNRETCAIISGGASGLGLGVVEAILAKQGKVVILDLNEPESESVQAQLGQQAQFIKLDISNEAAVNEAIENSKAFLKRCDLAVNCAGILGPGRVLGKNGPMAGEHFTKVININLIGAFLFTKAIANIMQDNQALNGERGVIIHTASIAGYEGQLGQAAYAASKAGVMGMVLPIAREFAKLGIRIMALAPGMFDTAMLQGLSDEIRNDLCAGIPFPSRFGTAEEFASTIEHVYNNQMLNGSVIRLDGAARLQ